MKLYIDTKYRLDCGTKIDYITFLKTGSCDNIIISETNLKSDIADSNLPETHYVEIANGIYKKIVDSAQ